ncbi:hypothetical protein Vpro01_02890 [Vibrio proteolyticus]
MFALHFRVEFNRRILLKNVMKIQEKLEFANRYRKGRRYSAGL